MQSKKESFWDFWNPILLTIFFYVICRHYLAEARYIPSGSMLPGLQINDRLLIEKITFRSRAPKHGEIVVFESPYSFDDVLISQRKKKLPSSFKCSFVGFPFLSWIPGFGDPACDAYIKRVVAVEGDRIAITSRGKIYLNGKFLNEKYVSNYCPEVLNGFNSCRPLNTRVPSGHVLVLGDNRSNSWDSRFWPGGPFLPVDKIIGRAAWRFWPIHRSGSLKL